MRKIYVVLTLAAMTVAGALMAPGAQAQTLPDVKSVVPFTQGANYMSLPGYLRYQTLLQQGRWLSREEAERAVADQGAPIGAPATNG